MRMFFFFFFRVESGRYVDLREKLNVRRQVRDVCQRVSELLRAREQKVRLSEDFFSLILTHFQRYHSV